MQKTLLFVFSIWLTSMLVSCKNEEPQIDPKKAILGKWEITHLGDSEGLDPYPANKNFEYLPDSLMLIYRYDLESYSGTKYKYWFTDSLLIQSFVFIDNIDKDTIVFKFPYKYDFITPDKLRLEFIYPTFSGKDISIYKRIN